MIYRKQREWAYSIEELFHTIAGELGNQVEVIDMKLAPAGIFLESLGDSSYRDQLVGRGLRNVARYSPATISGQYLDLYKRLTHL